MSSANDPGGEPAGTRRGGLRALLAGLSWRSAVIFAAIGVAFASWAPVMVVCCLVWVSRPEIGFGAVLVVSGRIWLLANGVPASTGGGAIGLVPLGLTALIVLMVVKSSGNIARRAADELIEGPVRARQQSDLRALSCRLALWFGGSYAVVLIAATVLVGQPVGAGRALVCGLLIGGGCSLPAAGRALGWAPMGLSQGGWSTGILAGAAAAAAGVILLGCARLAVVLVANRSTVTGVHESLGAGGPGSVALSLAQMLWVPSVVVWAASWVLGAGFLLGRDALVAPVGSSAGDLPAIPLLAAVSTGDTGPALVAVWLLAAACAGALGAHVCVRARCDEAHRALPRRALDPAEGALSGLVVGVIAALLLFCLALFSRGALGTQRLAEMGPVLTRLAVLAPTVLGAGGMVGGFCTALRCGRGATGEAPAG